ncbi:MAG: biopolymer transporter Tol [Firmicutes bacterium]|nr:biopolymer transporter Tol [Bacillota bacterium]
MQTGSRYLVFHPCGGRAAGHGSVPEQDEEALRRNYAGVGVIGMKVNTRLLIRCAVAYAGIIVVSGVIMWLNHTAQPSPADVSQALQPARAEPNMSPPATAHDRDGPEVNTAPLGDQDDLAFVWRGLLYVVEGETGKVRQLTDSGRAAHPAWSNDGQWLAFVRVTDPGEMTGQLWVVRRDGSQGRQIQGLPGPVGARDFSWSPAENVLAVGVGNSVWVAAAEGEPRHLALAPGLVWCAWSPDGKSLAYNATLAYDDPVNRSDALYTVDVKGGEPVKRVEASQAGVWVAAWWPDNSGLLYWSDPLHSASLAADGMTLMRLRLGSQEPRPTATTLGYREWLSFSPQGRLVVVAGGGREAWSGKRLAIVDPKAGPVRELKNARGCVALDPSFSPDGRRIAYVTAQDLSDGAGSINGPEQLAAWVATRTLWVADADGSGARPLTEAGSGIYRPVWSRDGTRVFYMRDNALWTITLEGGRPEKVLGPFPEEKNLFGYYGFATFNAEMAWFWPRR